MLDTYQILIRVDPKLDMYPPWGTRQYLGDNTKHIAPKFFYNQQQQKTLNIEVKQVSSEENLADLFTKSLPKSTFVKHVKSIGMCRLSELDD